jgi:hypothetical protein
MLLQVQADCVAAATHVVGSLAVAALLQQVRHHLSATGGHAGCVVQRGLTARVCCIDGCRLVRRGLHQQLHHGGVAVAAGHVEGGGTVLQMAAGKQTHGQHLHELLLQ